MMSKFMEMQMQQNQQHQQLMQQMQDQHLQNLKNNLARSKNMENQLVQLSRQLANNNNQERTFQINTQTTPDEKDNNPMKNEESGESVKGVENNEKERMFEGCGVKKIVKEIDTLHEVELPQELPYTEEANTVDKEQVMMAAEENEGLFSKEESCEQKKEMENKAEVDRVIDEICVLFNKKELGRIWTPQHLYLKFMEFLPNRRKKTDDVLSVSFWPP
ncbi:probable E3 ubiquitin-protein ligase bre1 [Trifolium pratense]|uniref:probable E3 ubiquitin-protein ligase bre1 n=1 Tax=Trifolium pratense TaxID=57577 RepID=UPI001E69345A|nr:probable E3 ubiquitin-protein ligase bre1 [Trifolium pratense]